MNIKNFVKKLANDCFVISLISISIYAIFMTHFIEGKTVVIIGKNYVPAWTGAGEQSSSEEYNLYIRRIDTSSFMPPLNLTTRIVGTNRESYNKLSIGDTLQDKH